MGYHLYILYSNTGDRYYIGSSGNPIRKVKYHNTVENGFTLRYRPWKLGFTKGFHDKKSAQRAERKVKSWKSRVMIKKLITGEIDI